MSKFLSENWIWIVAPIVFVAVLMTGLVLFTQGHSADPFIYSIF